MLANFLSNIIDLLTAIHKLKVPVHHLNILGVILFTDIFRFPKKKKMLRVIIFKGALWNGMVLEAGH